MILEELQSVDAPFSESEAAAVLAGVAIGVGILALIGC